MPGWERWVRRLRDTEDVEIFVTGSSSQLLTRDLATDLRGRSVTLEVFPLSFREYLEFRGIEVRAHDADTLQRERAAMAFGAERWPEAEGTLLYHEYGPGRERDVPGAQAAWRYLLRP